MLHFRHWCMCMCVKTIFCSECENRTKNTVVGFALVDLRNTACLCNVFGFVRHVCPSPLTALLAPPAGQHLHCGLRRRLPRDHTGSSLRFHLHRFRNHPQRSANIHPLQQVLRLLLQAQVQSVHRLHEESREGQICQEDHKKGRPLLWKPPLSRTLISSVTFSEINNMLHCKTVQKKKNQMEQVPSGCVFQ